MAAVPEDLETQAQLRAVSSEAVSAELASNSGEAQIGCGSVVSLSRDEVRAMSRRIVAEHQRMIALLATYDSQQSGLPNAND